MNAHKIQKDAFYAMRREARKHVKTLPNARFMSDKQLHLAADRFIDGKRVTHRPKVRVTPTKLFIGELGISLVNMTASQQYGKLWDFTGDWRKASKYQTLFNRINGVRKDRVWRRNLPVLST